MIKKRGNLKKDHLQSPFRRVFEQEGTIIRAASHDDGPSRDRVEAQAFLPRQVSSEARKKPLRNGSWLIVDTQQPNTLDHKMGFLSSMEVTPDNSSLTDLDQEN